MDLKQAVERVVEEVLGPRPLASEPALLWEPGSDVHGPVLTVSSGDGRSAEIQVHLENEQQLDLLLGRATRFELFARTPDRLLEQFREIVDAVAYTGMHEVVWTDKHGLIVRSRAALKIGGTERTYRWRGGLFGRGVNAISYDYLPYERDHIAWGGET